ncbi:RmlC-like cupin domain-containing protein [Mycena sanguinolenta]|nr:RmlC-like cupin domain-containing protein [Mycena sanguinolenta]
MFSKSLAAFVVLSTVLRSMPVVSTPLSDKVAELRLDPTAVDRVNSLSSDDQFVFDFLNPPAGVVTGAAGHTVTATSGTFPAVVGNGVAMTVGFFGPCGINTPHTHPRATEINFSVNGTLRAGLLTENGARFVMNELPPGSMMVFPQGAVHFEMNDGCEPAMFVAAFNSEDPGVLSVAQRFFGLPIDILAATMGGLGVQQVEGLEAMIPDNIAVGTDACLQRCGLHRPPAQPTAQHQPRVSGNAFPTGTIGSTSNITSSPQPTSSVSLNSTMISVSTNNPTSTQVSANATSSSAV